MPTIPAPNPLRTEAVLPVVVCFLVVTATVGTTVVGAGAPAPNPDPDRPAAAGAEDPRPESSPRPANDRRPSEPVRQAGATATDRTNRSDDGSAIGSTVDGENGTENRTGDGTVGASAGGTGNGSSSAASPAALDPTAVPSGDWPNLFRDAGQTAVNPRSDAPDSFPEVRWSTGFGSTPSSPVATDGRLYLNVGGDVLHAVDRQSGDIDWTNASNVQDFAPVVADGSVVTYPRTGGFFFVTQNMAAYAADSGRQQWSITPEGISSWITAPVVGDGTIYLGYDTRVSAYAAGSGEHQWTRPLQDQPRAPLLTSNGQVYVRQVNGNFSAFDADDGSPEWNVSLGVESLAAQAATDRAVFVANGSGIAALAHGDGSRVWGVGGFSRTGAMVAGEETVYASLKNDTASGVLAVDASTGERQWWQPEVGQSFTDTDRMAAIDGILYVATDGGTLYALDRDDGGIRWSWDRTRPLQYPVPIDDSLYVVGGSTLYALEDRDVDAGIAVEPDPPTAGATTELNVSAVINELGGPGQLTGINWSFGDGGTASGLRVFHTFDRPGEYEVTATIRTFDGFRFDVTRTVTVAPPEGDEPEITLVAASPPGEVPGHPRITKTYTVGTTAPSGVERVVFEVMVGDRVVATLVDRDGSDGWTAAVPTIHGSDSAVRIRAAAASGATASRTVDLGVVTYGPFVEYILENGELQALSDGRYAVSVVVPPVGKIEREIDLSAVGQFSLTFFGQVAVAGRFAPPRNTITGQAELEATAEPVRVAGKGTIRGVSREGVSKLEFETIEGSFELEGGAYREFDDLPSQVPASVEASYFVGVYGKGQPRWEDGLDMLTAVPYQGGVKGSGSVSAEAGAQWFVLEGAVEGEAGIETDLTAPTEDVNLTGEIKLKGRAILLFTAITFEVVLFSATLDVVRQSSGAATTRLRRKGEASPTTPAALRNESVGQQAGAALAADADATADAETDVGTRPGRLTADRVADGSPSVAGTGEGFLVAWDRQPADAPVLDGHEITVRRYADGAFGPPTNLTDDRRMDVDPSVAAGANGSRLAAWTRVNRTVTEPSAADPDRTFGATEVAVATRNDTAGWSPPELLTEGSGAAFSPRVAFGDGRYLIAWRADADGNYTTRDDRSVRYVTYDPDTEAFGPVRSVDDARRPRVAGDADTLRLVVFEPTASAGGSDGGDGRLLVRDVVEGTGRTVQVTDLVDLAATVESITWLRGPPDNRTLRYAAGDRSGRIGTDPVAAPTDVGAVTRTAADGRPVTVVTFRGRTVDGNTTTTPAVFYRARDGTRWTAPARLSPETASLSFGQSATGGGAEGFLTAFVGRNVSNDDERNDVFFARHRYGAALELDASANGSAPPGDPVEVEYAVANGGAVTAGDVTVTVTAADGNRTLTESSLGAVAPGDRATGVALVPAPADEAVELRATTTTAQLPRANATATVVTSRPDLAFGPVVRTPGADNVSYTVAVKNVGDSPAGATSVALTNRRESVASAAVPSLAPGESRTTTLTVDVRDLNRYALTRVRIDPADRVGERNETNNDRVVATTLPDLTLSRERASFDADDRELAVTVGNRGPGATDAVVTVSAGNATTTRRTSIPGAPPGSDTADTTVRVPLAGLSLSANDTVLVRADPDAPESNNTDNLIAVTVPKGVGGPPPVVGDAVPTDPDGDGRYEDIDGDGEFSVVDVAVLLDNLDAPAVTDNPGFFEFNPDGSIDVIDVAELLEET